MSALQGRKGILRCQYKLHRGRGKVASESGPYRMQALDQLLWAVQAGFDAYFSVSKRSCPLLTLNKLLPIIDIRVTSKQASRARSTPYT